MKLVVSMRALMLRSALGCVVFSLDLIWGETSEGCDRRLGHSMAG